AVLVTGLTFHHQGLIGGAVAVLAGFALFGAGELLTGLPGAFARIGRSEAAAARLNGLTGLKPALPAPDVPRTPPRGGALVFQDVGFRHNAAAPWLFRDMDLRVEPEEIVAVTGRSGSGKSSLAYLAARLIDPEVGCVTYSGVDLRAIDPAVLRRRVGLLTQHSELFDDTLAWNLRIADPGAGAAELWRALEVAGLADMVAGLPDGLDTPVGESGVAFSGGQARRLALARLVLADPELVVLDEPLRGLDAATAAAVSDSLDRWLDGRTAILLAHDAGTLPPVERILNLDGTGKLQRVSAARRTARDKPVARL
ncbi:ATP-binding cassette domain-containing protein, partial [Ectothiorhodospiraceae bacterium WFHF3C12]|nr:ATP-binding cassette domain-containing protein [Ectothiorhodospiraceae bacterium WFHF3C12]